jgi:formylglycine-generating enzyme required for sulfatase activity
MGTDIFERAVLKQFKDEPNYPVVLVSWNQAQEFCRKLTEREREKGLINATQAYRLPTEAEWEYACRAGTTTAYSYGDDPTVLNDYGWWGGLFSYDDPEEAAKHEKHFHVVGAKLPNPWGLYDMHGNVFEWCQDVYDQDAYKAQATETDEKSVDPAAPHVIRSGSWVGQGWITRCAKRQGSKDAGKAIGFRVVRTN